MLQNKIYLNFLTEIFKTFLVIIFAFTLIAFTARAVSFLDLLVESGYNVNVYFSYSVLNLFGIAPKFIPLSFLLALIIFIIKRIEDSEFIILWTSGVKKISLVNLFLFFSLIIMIFYFVFSLFLTPYILYKSRILLSENNFSSFLPTVKAKQFSDSFKNFTVYVESKNDNELKEIFLNDKGNNIQNFSSNKSKLKESTIFAENGIVDKKRMILFNGQIVSTKVNSDIEIIKFEQLNIDLGDLSTTTIKKPKIQETSTFDLLDCLINKKIKNNPCNKEFVSEILPVLNKRITAPFYIPILSLICSLLLINSKKIYLNKIFVFGYGFSILLFVEITVRYTGLNSLAMLAFVLMPFLLIIFLYFILTLNLSNENKNK